MSGLSLPEYFAIGLMFVWGGFARSGLGFGGAALTLPFLLLIVDNPVYVLPIIAIHLLVFGGLTVGTRLGHVDWRYLGRSLLVILPFKIAGVIGLLNLPGEVLTGIVYVITVAYALAYISRYNLQSRGGFMDTVLLALGGYISGTSLIGAPLIIVVYARHVARESFRETLFALWIVLVLIKLSAFVVTGTDLQLIHQLWLLPCAGVGHYFGLKLHARLVAMESAGFMRAIGFMLLAVTVLGVWTTYFAG